MNFLADYNPLLNIVWILLGVAAIALVVFLLRKYIPGIKGSDEVSTKDENQIAEDNVKSKLVEFKPEEEKDEDEE